MCLFLLTTLSSSIIHHYSSYVEDEVGQLFSPIYVRIKTILGRGIIKRTTEDEGNVHNSVPESRRAEDVMIWFFISSWGFVGLEFFLE